MEKMFQTTISTYIFDHGTNIHFFGWLPQILDQLWEVLISGNFGGVGKEKNKNSRYLFQIPTKIDPENHTFVWKNIISNPPVESKVCVGCRDGTVLMAMNRATEVPKDHRSVLCV